MSTRKIFEQVLPGLLNSQFAVLVVLGGMIWLASLMSPNQLNTLTALFGILRDSGLVGVVIGIVLLLLLAYALIFWPVGRFLSGIITKYSDIQVEHHTMTTEHHTASKGMAYRLEDIYRNTEEIKDRIEAHEDKVVEFFGAR